jgi:putative endonuclease
MTMVGLVGTIRSYRMGVSSMNQYYVYIMASFRQTLYVGVTNDLRRRVYQHKTKADPASFTSRYNVDRLVHFEVFTDVKDAIAREKQIKRWRRSKKVALIEAENPRWKDLSLDWE